MGRSFESVRMGVLLWMTDIDICEKRSLNYILNYIKFKCCQGLSIPGLKVFILPGKTAAKYIPGALICQTRYPHQWLWNSINK
jgi:hypothetical protein